MPVFKLFECPYCKQPIAVDTDRGQEEIIPDPDSGDNEPCAHFVHAHLAVASYPGEKEPATLDCRSLADLKGTPEWDELGIGVALLDLICDDSRREFLPGLHGELKVETLDACDERERFKGDSRFIGANGFYAPDPGEFVSALVRELKRQEEARKLRLLQRG